jgi:hypothetical protein
MINLGFLTEGKLAAILITPSSWGSQRAGHSPRITQLTNAYIYDQDCVGARHLKNYFFYHLRTRGRAGVKLWDA